MARLWSLRRCRWVWALVTVFLSATLALGVTPRAKAPGAPAARFDSAPQPDAVPRPATPSVLLITLDTVGAGHLGCYGYRRIQTPNLDRLAAEGVRFANAYTQVPITLPSHAVILTGTTPMFNGVRDFTSTGLPLDIPTLAEKLERGGYRTAAFVSSFVLDSMWGLNRGFELYDDNVGLGVAASAAHPFLLARAGDRTVDRLLAWLDRAQGKGKPFFAWLHLYDAHSPYRAPDSYRRRYPGRPYDAAIAFDDAQVGRVIDRLLELRLYNDTLLVVLSDHGESLGEHGEAEHGFFVYDATLRVPLILKLPGAIEKGRVESRPVSTLDIAPAIAQIAKLPAAETGSFQGQSLLRAVKPGAGSPNEAVYAESYYPRDSFGWHELRALITARYKFVDAPRPELYDLERDPGEQTNIIATNSAIASSLRDRLSSLETRLAGRDATAERAPLDPETLEKLKSLGYLSYKAGTPSTPSDAARADPKDKIATLNKILHAADLMHSSQRAEADELLAALERDEPGLYVVPFERAENALAWGRPQAAVEEFQKSLDRNPSFDQAAEGLGRSYLALGDGQHAQAALELALKLNPRNFLARASLAEVYWGANQLEKAEAELEQVVKAHSEFVEGHADYGIILTKLKKYREGASEIERAIQAGYREATAYNYLGIAHAQLGDHERARRDYQQAVQVDPRYAAAYLNLALEYRSQGQLAQAQSYFKKVCHLSGDLCRQYASQFPR